MGINPQTLFLTKKQKNIKWKKECIFNKWCWHNWISTCGRMKNDPYLCPCTKINSKWYKDFNIKPAKMNLIEEKVLTLERIGTGDHFPYNPSSTDTERNN